MFETPSDIGTVIKNRNKTINWLITINIVTVTILTLLFLGIFGIDFRVHHFLFSYRLVLLPFIIVIQFILFQRFFIFLWVGILNINGKRLTRQDPGKQFGKYTASEILDIVDEQCRKMKVTSVKAVYVTENRLANMMTTDVILFKPFRYSVIIIFSNSMDILNHDELTAVIGHEVAHVKNYDSWHLGLVGSPTQIMTWAVFLLILSIPFGTTNTYFILYILLILFIFYFVLRLAVNRMVQYCEYFADYTSAKVNGLIPVVNGLIKMGQRWDTLVAFQQEFQRRFRLDRDQRYSSEFFKKLYKELEDVVDPDEAIKVAKRVVEEHGGEEIPTPQGSQNIEFFKPKIIDWRKYDNHIRDYSLDCIELDQLVKDLRDSPHAQLFKYASSSKFVNLFKSHPEFRSRIIFLWDTQRDCVQEPGIPDVQLLASLKNIEDLIAQNLICPVCQSKFRFRKHKDGLDEPTCPGCGIPGKI
jgi:Zn-dependent protease with chaperone function